MNELSTSLLAIYTCLDAHRRCCLLNWMTLSTVEGPSPAAFSKRICWSASASGRGFRPSPTCTRHLNAKEQLVMIVT